MPAESEEIEQVLERRHRWEWPPHSEDFGRHRPAHHNLDSTLACAECGYEAMKARCKKAVALWRGEVERLQAENERLRKVENDALWLARLACSSSWPMDMAQQVENAAERVKAAFSGSEVNDGI